MVKCTTKKQFEELVRQMELNPNIGRGIRAFGETKASAELVWAEVSNNLNSYGPPVRTSEEWQRVWIHYKAKLKKNMAKNKRNLYMTGGGPSEEVTLSPLEQSVADLLQMDLVVNPNGNIFGASQKENTPEREFDPEKYNEQQQIDEPQKKKQQEPQKKKRRTKIQSSKIEKQLWKKNEILKEIKNLKIKKYEVLTEIKELKQKKYNALLNEQTLNTKIKEKNSKY